MNEKINIEEYQKYLCTTGKFEFFGLPMSQVPKAVLYISNLLQLIEPTRIIEFGTGRGGLSFLLGIYSQIKNITFQTYDHVSPKEQFELNIPPIPYLPESYYKFLDSFFLKKDLRDKDVRNNIREDIKREEGNVVIFCDALKSIEFAEFSPILRKGDAILVHDYGRNYNDQVWNRIVSETGWSAPQEQWLERNVDGVKIKDIAEKYNIDYTILSDMENVIWFCGIKK